MGENDERNVKRGWHNDPQSVGETPMMSPEAKKNLRGNADASSPTENQEHPALTLPSLPSDMVVTIDGTSTLTRRPIGELVAQALGAVLVDSGRFYRSLTMSCIEAGVDLEDWRAVSEHCEKARLDVWVRKEGGLFEEALVFVNGDLFNKSELAAVHNETPKVAFVPVARHMVNFTIQEMQGSRRLVVLGRDLGARLFQATPFKFFVSTPVGAAPQLSSQNVDGDLDFGYRNANQNNTIQPIGALAIDGGSLSPAQAREKILSELLPQLVRHEEEEKRFVEHMERDK